MDPAISVVVVCDYAPGTPEGWDDVRKSLISLSRQELDEPVEFLFCESERFRNQVPPDLTAIVPSLRTLFFTDDSSYALKNHAVAAASAEFVAFLDADCIAAPSWLRGLLSALRVNSNAAAVSGRTVYPGRSLGSRVCGLLARSYLDPGHAGQTRFIAINNCGFRRSAYLAHPLPVGIGTFSSRIQSEALYGDGWVLLFDPEISVVHDFEGWAMEADVRRNAGHGTIATRLADSSLPYASLTRWGWPSIVPILAGKVVDSWRDCFRCGRDYGVRWFELPAAMLISLGVHMLEVPGMLQAFNSRVLPKSHFR